MMYRAMICSQMDSLDQVLLEKHFI